MQSRDILSLTYILFRRKLFLWPSNLARNFWQLINIFPSSLREDRISISLQVDQHSCPSDLVWANYLNIACEPDSWGWGGPGSHIEASCENCSWCIRFCVRILVETLTSLPVETRKDPGSTLKNPLI